MRKKLLYSLIGVIVLAYGGFIATLVAGNKPALGLDLQGGISVTQQPVPPFNASSLDLAVERIRARVDSLGVAEPEILRQGDTIVVNLPGVKNQKQAEDLVKVTGQVLLRPVLTEPQVGAPCVTGDPNRTATPTTTTTTVAGATTSTVAAATASSVGGASTVGSVAPNTTAAGGPSRHPSTANTSTTVGGSTAPQTTGGGATTSAPPGTTVPGAPTTTVAGTPVNTLPPVAPEATGYVKARGASFPCYVGPAGGTGEVFQDDATARILQGGWGVTVSLRSGAKGEGVWNALAAQCFNGGPTCPTHQLAIDLDGEVISAPTVQTANFPGSVEITGRFSQSEANNLARVLNSGSWRRCRRRLARILCVPRGSPALSVSAWCSCSWRCTTGHSA
jgi:preprotein translocase subunit SecD